VCRAVAASGGPTTPCNEMCCQPPAWHHHGTCRRHPTGLHQLLGTGLQQLLGAAPGARKRALGWLPHNSHKRWRFRRQLPQLTHQPISISQRWACREDGGTGRVQMRARPSYSNQGEERASGMWVSRGGGERQAGRQGCGQGQAGSRTEVALTASRADMFFLKDSGSEAVPSWKSTTDTPQVECILQGRAGQGRAGQGRNMRVGWRSGVGWLYIHRWRRVGTPEACGAVII